jgi:hypothetical protein
VNSMVNLIDVRVVNPNGYARSDDIIAGLDYAVGSLVSSLSLPSHVSFFFRRASHEETLLFDNEINRQFKSLGTTIESDGICTLPCVTRYHPLSLCADLSCH